MSSPDVRGRTQRATIFELTPGPSFIPHVAVFVPFVSFVVPPLGSSLTTSHWILYTPSRSGSGTPSGVVRMPRLSSVCWTTGPHTTWRVVMSA